MKTAVDLAKKIYKEPEKNWLSELEEINIHVIFRPVYKENFQIEILNKIVSFVILAYDNDSPWLDSRKDRRENKLSILQGIDVDVKSKIFQQIINYENDKIQEVILNYLVSMTDARWQESMSLLDYSSKMILYCNREVREKNIVDTKIDENGAKVNIYEYIDPLDVSKINKEKGDLLLKAIAAREKGEQILKSIESDFQRVDAATQGDFNFVFSDVKKFNIMSWEDRIRKRRQIV